MKVVLLSIKPKFVERIRNGEKRFEYRKKIFKDQSVSKLLIYSSSPVKQIVAECWIRRVLVNSPQIIWHETKKESGITSDYFFRYFDGKSIAYAIEFDSVRFYSSPKVLKTLGVKKAPQSFCYVEFVGFDE
jgi:predicted transcriptional regulator